MTTPRHRPGGWAEASPQKNRIASLYGQMVPWRLDNNKIAFCHFLLVCWAKSLDLLCLNLTVAR